MSTIQKLAVAALASTLLLLGACGDDDTDASDSPGTTATDQDDGSDADDGDDDGSDPAPTGGSSGGTATFGGEEVTIQSVRCFFQEQPRAGLGGVFTHSLQAAGVDAAGEEIIIDMTRARGEDGEVEDDLSYDVGDPFGDDFVSYSAGGPEGTITFGDDGASATDLSMEDFGEEPLLLSFDLSC